MQEDRETETQKSPRKMHRDGHRPTDTKRRTDKERSNDGKTSNP